MTDQRPHFLSEPDVRALFQQLVGASSGGGITGLSVKSLWTGNIRWGRNQIISSGEKVDHEADISRTVRGAFNAGIRINDLSPNSLLSAVRRAERLLATHQESNLVEAVVAQPLEATTTPSLFSDATYSLDTEQRAVAARALMRSAAERGLLSAGYLQVSALSMGMIDTTGRSRYFRWTEAQYSVTVRDPKGMGSGWAGGSHYDWSKIDAPKLSEIALDKCVRSMNPARVEPGRYTTILEPQATGEMMPWFMSFLHETFRTPADELDALRTQRKIIDERITLSSDPMDPEIGVVPWGEGVGGPDIFHRTTVPHATTWVKAGRYYTKASERMNGIAVGQDRGMARGGLRMSGGTTSIDEMIVSTARGLYVTRFSNLECLSPRSLLMRGITRDGTWLIEHGKITKPVKNLFFTELMLGMFNNVEQLGVPQRIFSPAPSYYRWGFDAMLIPPLKIRDFSFTALTDAV